MKESSELVEEAGVKLNGKAVDRLPRSISQSQNTADAIDLLESLHAGRFIIIVLQWPGFRGRSFRVLKHGRELESLLVCTGADIQDRADAVLVPILPRPPWKSRLLVRSRLNVVQDVVEEEPPRGIAVQPPSPP